MDAGHSRSAFTSAEDSIPRLLKGDVYNVDMEDRQDQVYGNLHIRVRNSTCHEWAIVLTHGMEAEVVKASLLSGEIGLQDCNVHSGYDILYNTTIWNTWQSDSTCRQHDRVVWGPVSGQEDWAFTSPAMRTELKYKYYLDMFKILSMNPLQLDNAITEEVIAQVKLPFGLKNGDEMRCIINPPVRTPYRRELDDIIAATRSFV